MDIDISHFSKKAQLRLYNSITQPVFFPILWLIFSLLLIACVVGVVYWSIEIVDCEELILPALIISIIIFSHLSFSGIKYLFLSRLNKFSVKIIDAGCFPKCYECNEKADAENKCPKCNKDLTVKLVDSEVTLKQSIKMRGLAMFYTFAVTIAIVMATSSFMSAWKHRGTYTIYFAHETGKVQTWIPFYLNEKVSYKGNQVRIKAITAPKNRSIAYTIETSNGKIIEGVSGYELKAIRE